MKHLHEFRDKGLASSLAAELEQLVDGPVRFMEVCGTHTMAIFRHGLRSILPEDLHLISGPGCPVCVTSAGYIDAFIKVALIPLVTIATFGDMVRVPGTSGSLAHARSQGARVEVVYSPMDALDLAEQRPKDLVVFPAIGFETTVPGMAATILEARRRKQKNFAVFSAHKVMPPALDALMSNQGLQIQGLLCPGHVSTIIGAKAYKPLAERYSLSCVIAGFEPIDILQALILLARQAGEGRAEVENAYPRAVSWEGNARAQGLISKVFEPVDAEWRGMGIIPGSGLALRPEFSEFNALERLDIKIPKAPEPKGCRCGEILVGRCLPPDCPLFAKGCTPLEPVGPCMVSTEGTCAAYYRYGRFFSS